MMRSFFKTIEHGVKRLVFTLCSTFLRRGRSDFATIIPATVKRVLFIRPEKLGDMIISLPVFDNLKRAYPHLELYVICSPRNVAIVREDDRLTAYYLYTKNVWRDFGMLRKVRRMKPDVVVDMICDDSVTALFLTHLSCRDAWHIGVGKNRHRAYYDFNYQFRTGDGAHVIDNTLKLLTAFGIDTDSLNRYVPPTIPADRQKTADRFYASLNEASSPVIGLNISAGRPTRVWQEEKNQELIRRLLDRFPQHQIIISADPHEHDRAAALAARFPRRAAAVPAGLNLLEISAIISRMTLLISPDTSLVHIARAFKVPVVGLYTRFGKNFEMWRPYGQETGTVISHNDYNIFDIEVDDVFDMVLKLMPTGEQ
ncbi:MAG: glycosyltransferase family 9 protein [candidate division Zixibacteria bacterium]|nr:glycosyltransferase family 9 protein [candidate division Zixibacteria bacterium]